MFSKKSAEPAQSAQANPAAAKSPARSRGNKMAQGSSTFSVIGPDVTIKGDISASADLHIDGKIEGELITGVTTENRFTGDGTFRLERSSQ